MIWDPQKLQISREPSPILGLPAFFCYATVFTSMSKTKSGGPFKFHPFIDDAFVHDLQVLSKKIPGTTEQRLHSMSWCDRCEDHSSEASLGDGLVDTGVCQRCGMEQWGFHRGETD